VVYIAAPLSFALFAAGILFGYYVLIRFGLQFLASYGNPELVHSMMSLDFYFGLVIMLTLIMGVVFQLPLVMLALAKIEIWPVSAMKRQRKFAILLIFIVAAVITPTPDPITQTLLAVPLIFLYEFGIILSRAWTPREEEDETKAGAAEETA
jgi:Sec-independent protein secretion pathway component TatC